MGGLPLLKASGLQTAHNPFSGVSDGSLSVAQNVLLFSNGVVEPRRGHRQLSYTMASKSNSGAFYGETLLAHFSSGTLAYDTGSAFTSYAGTVTPADDDLLRIKFVESKGNLYFNTAAGMGATESAAGTLRAVGLPPPRITASFNNAALEGLGGDIAPNDWVAVRATYIYTDANGSEIESAPSARYLIDTNLVTDDGSIVISHTLPATVPASTKIRIYCTEAVNGASTDTLGDEMYLVYETAQTSFYIKKINLSDVPLYTNGRNGEGINQANWQPPIAKDITQFASRQWFANTTSPHRFQLQVLGTGSPNGIQANDTITVNGVTFTAKASPALSTEFAVFTGGTATSNIYKTARALAATLNAYSGLGVTAYDFGGGNLTLESTTLGASAFTVYASRAESWNPELPSTAETALSSDNNRLKNGLLYSKPDQPEAVPLVNYLLIGPKNKEILRVIPLREKMFVFSEAGIYTVAGDEPFSVDLLDATTRLVCPDSACVLNNQIIALTNQGVVAVSDAGVQILSRPIEDLLLPYLNASMRDTVKRYAFGVAHETDRTYELWVPGAAADAQSCTAAFVYSPITQTWTTWEVDTGRTWGVVSPTDVRYYGGLDGKVLKERRDYASSDYADETLAVTVSAYDGTTLTLSSVSGIEVGDCFTVSKAGGEQTTPISAIDGSTITVGEEILSQFQSGGTTIVEKGIDCEVKWTPIAYDRPGSEKRFQYGTYHYARPTAFTMGYATYSTEQSGTDTDETLTRSTDGWGTNAWDSSPWGDPMNNFNVRHIIPMEKQRAAMLTPGFRIREARAGWKLLGLTLDTEETSERNSRG